MGLMPHTDRVVRRLAIGREQVPLLVIDNAAPHADELVELAASKIYSDVATYFPGVRAKTPLTYHQFVLEQFRSLFVEFFGLTGKTLRFTDCHFSLVTTPPERLEHLQRIPHIDSLHGTELAFVHYLFKKELGGTAFYRHRNTGFEFVDQARAKRYFDQVALENNGPDKAPLTYINGDTPLYEQVGREEGVFNRMLVYRRNTLHSASIGTGFVPDANPRTGRLSINGFLA